MSAIIFDLDDTLVPTSTIDRAAIASAVEQAIALEAATDSEGTIAAFRELLKSEPFPPVDDDQLKQLSVAAWRTSLWARALKPDAPEGAATAVYECWAGERLRNFQFSDEVRALLGRLEETGLKMVIVTNGHTDVQRPKVRNGRHSTPTSGECEVRHPLPPHSTRCLPTNRRLRAPPAGSW